MACLACSEKVAEVVVVVVAKAITSGSLAPAGDPDKSVTLSGDDVRC